MLRSMTLDRGVRGTGMFTSAVSIVAVDGWATLCEAAEAEKCEEECSDESIVAEDVLAPPAATVVD